MGPAGFMGEPTTTTTITATTTTTTITTTTTRGYRQREDLTKILID